MIRTLGSVCAVFVALTFVTASHVAAADYFVATTGNDSNSGSQSQPWRTPQHAADVAQPGDTVTIRAGTYGPPSGSNYVLQPARSGTANAPIIYRAFPGETVNLERAYTIIDLSNRSYIQLDGFTVRDVNANWGNWIYMENTTHCEIRNMNFTFTGQSTGVGWEGIRMINASYNRILNSRFDKWGIYGDPYNNGGDMIQLREGSHHNLVQDNYIGDAGHAGLQIDGGYLNAIRNNTFTNTIEKGLELTYRNNTTANLFRWNLIEGNTFTAAGFNSELHGGIHLHLNSNYNIVRRNIFRDAGRYGMDMQVWDTETVSTVGNHIFHNTFVHNGIWQNRLVSYSGTGAEITDFGYTGSPIGSHILKNNIFFDNLPNQGQDDSPGENVVIYLDIQPASGRGTAPWFGSVIAGNVLYGQAAGERVLHIGGGGGPQTVAQAQSAYPTNAFSNLQVNPQFVTYSTGVTDNPADGTYDLRLQSTSPAIDAGVALTTTRSAGSGTSVPVVDALFFTDGLDGIIDGDEITVSGQSATVTDIDYTTNTLTIDRSLSWSSGASVNLAYAGSGPDIGAFEYGEVADSGGSGGSGGADPTSAPTSAATAVPATPAPTPPVVPGDASGDGRVNGVDYVLVLKNFGKTVSSGPAQGDINVDGTVNSTDLNAVIGNISTGLTSVAQTPAPLSTTSSGIVVTITQPAQDNSLVSARSQTTFSATAYDSAIGTTNGSGIRFVDFEILDQRNQSIYTHTESDAAYCAFADTTFGVCDPMRQVEFEQLQPGATYRLRVRARSAAGTVSEWTERTFRR